MITAPMKPTNPSAKLSALRPVPILRGLRKESLFEVARQSVEVTYPAGATVVREGDAGDSLCVVASGTLEVQQAGRVIGRLTSGDYFGEISLIDGGPRSATVIALDDVVLLELSSGDFNSLLGIPYVARAVMTNLARMVRAAEAGP